MKKIKDFFLNVFKNIKLWFISHKRLLCIILLVFYVFMFGCGFGSCLQIYVNSQNSSNFESISACLNYDIDTSNYDISNDGNTVKIELGEISQVLFSSSVQVGTNYSIHAKTVGLPTVFCLYDLNDWNLMRYGIAFGDKYTSNLVPDIPNNNIYYKGVNFTQLSRSTNFNQYQSNLLLYGYNIFEDNNTYPYTTLIRYNGDLGSGIFGYELPLDISRTTEGNNGTAYSYFNSNPFTTYFMFATNRGNIDNYIAPTRLSSLYIDYWEFDNSINLNSPTPTTAFNNVGLYLHDWVTYNYTFDNGLKVAFGLPFYFKYPPNSNSVYPSDILYSYYDDSSYSAYQNGFNEGYKIGKSNGYKDGVSESLDNVSPFNAVTTFVNNLLGIKLFGDLSLGVIISVVFGFVMFGVLIKVFLGG